MSPAKVTLSPEEQELVKNSDWILTKNAVIAKVYALFGQLSEAYAAKMAACAPPGEPGIDLGSAKISKGEQYEGLPWVMLDHPRHFTATDTFAVRSFFWWGNFCSITLLLTGRFAAQYIPNVERYFAAKHPVNWHYCIHSDPWQHHFRPTNYQPLNAGSMPDLTALPFLKISRAIPLNDWNQLEDFFRDGFGEILEAVGFEL